MYDKDKAYTNKGVWNSHVLIFVWLYTLAITLFFIHSWFVSVLSAFLWLVLKYIKIQNILFVSNKERLDYFLYDFL